MQFSIPNMTCNGCARGVTAIIQDLDPNATVQVNLSDKTIQVQSKLSVEQIKNALDNDDFPATAH